MLPPAESQPSPAVEQLALSRLLVLFLVPGAVVTVAYVVLAPVIEAIGLPPIAALLLLYLLPSPLLEVLSGGSSLPAKRSGRPKRMPPLERRRHPLPCCSS